jgi:hypothetical protein
VFSTLFARWLLSTAWVIPAISLRSVSLAISPAGASLAELIFSRAQPLQAGRQIALGSAAAGAWPGATRMFVLIRLMRDPP